MYTGILTIPGLYTQGTPLTPGLYHSGYTSRTSDKMDGFENRMFVRKVERSDGRMVGFYIFNQEMSQPRLKPGGLFASLSVVKRRPLALKGSKVTSGRVRQFLISLYKVTLCSGFLCLKPLLSWPERVIS